MAKTISKKLYILIGSWIIPLILLNTACYSQRASVPEEKASQPTIKKMVVVGFRPAKSPGDKPGMIRGLLSGAVFMAEPVTKDVADRMTANLFDRLLKDKSYDLISPGQAMGVFSSLVSSDSAPDEIEIFQKIGKAFSSDTVLIGYIYRWREREGTDYAIDRPASVAFDLYLIRSDDGAISWKGRFDKTQRSLMENILDMDTFLKGKGKWMTAETLMELGLADLLEKLPKGVKTQED